MVMLRMLSVMCLILLAVFCSSCGGGGPDDEPVGQGQVILDGYFPFVSSIELPDQVYAGELTRFSISVEHPSDPTLLAGQPENGFQLAASAVSDQQTGQSGFRIDGMLRKHASGGNTRTLFAGKALFEEEGDQTIFILSAPAPEASGMPGQYELVGSPGPRTQGLIYREFPVTVLPARELE